MIGLGQPPAVCAATLSAPAGLRPAAAGDRPQLLEQHLLMLGTAGHGSHEVDFVAYPCRPGTVLWARPGQAVRFGAAPGFDAVAITWPVGFLPELPAGPWPYVEAFGPVCWQLAGEDEDAVIDEVSQLVVDCRRYAAPRRVGALGPQCRDDPGAQLLRHQLAVLALRLAMVPPVDAHPPGGGDGATYARFRRELEAGYLRCRQVAEYARRLGCSVRTLTRACLAATGRSAKQVIDERVVLEAKRLLAASDLPVAAIGRRLGFAEQTHFCRLFHRAVGCPPGVFRAGTQEPGRARDRARIPAPRSGPPDQLALSTVHH